MSNGESLILPDAPSGPSGSRFVTRRQVGTEPFILNPNLQIEANREKIDRFVGEAALLVGVIHAGERQEEHALFDMRGTTEKAPFQAIAIKDASRRVDIVPGRARLIGSREKTLLHPIKGVANPHFSVKYDADQDQLHIRGLHSTYPTFVTGHEALPPDPDGHMWANYTTALEDNLRQEGTFETGDINAPHGRYKGYEIIGSRSNTVRGGVYGTENSEHILVDDQNRVMKEVVNATMSKLEALKDQGAGQRELLRAIRDEVEGILHYDFDAVEKLSKPYYETKGFITLSDYVISGIGICRHSALLSALMMEQAIDIGLLEGTVSVRRNADLAEDKGHAWAELLNGRHAVIVDAAQHYVGTREEAKSDPRRWNYYKAVE